MLRKKPIPRSTQTPLTDNLTVTEYKIRKEIAIMKKLRHPHVVQLLEVMDDRMKEKIYMGEPRPSYHHVSVSSFRRHPISRRFIVTSTLNMPI